MHDSYRRYDTTAGRQGLGRWSERLLDYVRSRRTEHWIMFGAGLVLGLLLG